MGDAKNAEVGETKGGGGAGKMNAKQKERRTEGHTLHSASGAPNGPSQKPG